MGSIRTLLAISVVFTHTYGFVFVGGQLAVQLFYVISGYLISYILVEANAYTSTTAFYKNRFLRLFPIYWLVAITTLIIFGGASFFFSIDYDAITTFNSLDGLGKVSLVLSNIFLFGQDWIMFTGVRDGIFQLVTDFHDTDVYVPNGLLVPQAWTLGVELSFYLIAPFVLVRQKLMIFLLSASLLLRAYLIYIGLGLQDPWTYRFFPTELIFFLAGAFSHQYLKPYLEQRKAISKVTTNLVTVGVFSFIVVLFLLPYKSLFAMFLIGIFILALPMMFSFQSSNKWDGKIGELSYPIYISHILLIEIFRKFLNVDTSTLTGALLIVVVTIIVSYLINLSIGSTVENWRSKIKKNQISPQ